MIKRTFPIAVLTALAALATGCGETKQAAAPAAAPLAGVNLVVVRRATVPDVIEAVGTVRARQSSQLSSQMVATVTAVRVHEGQSVRRGDVLVVLDDAQQSAALSRSAAAVTAAQQEIGAAQAEDTLAAATLRRYQSLYEKKSVSPHEMDEVEARAAAAAAHRQQADAGLAQADALQAQARAGLSYTRIRAPFDGVVTAKFVDPGALAAPGVPLLTMEDTGRFRLEAAVDESDIPLVKLGAPAAVTLDALGDVQGTVVQIVPAADPASRTFTVKIELPADPRLRSGLFGRANFTKGERQAILLPREAVVERGQLQGVYVLGADGTVNLRFVTLGRAAGDRVEVLSGVDEGDKLVTNPGDRELAGRRVEARL